MKAYLLGRANRSEYWICVVCMTIACMVANVILRNPTLVSGLSFIPWAVISSRRLRDFGWSRWWCVSTVSAGFVIGFVGSMINDIAGQPLISRVMFSVAYGVTNWAIIIFIGSRKSVEPKTSGQATAAEAALLRTFD